MISLISDLINEYDIFCSGDALGTRIMSLLYSYGAKKPFALFWEQRDKNQVLTALISKIDNSITVHSKNADEDELKEFINAIGFESLSATPEFVDFIGFDCKVIIKTIMKYKDSHIFKSVKDGEKGSINIDLNKIYDIIIVCNNINSTKEHYEAWITDISHRIRHGYADAVTAQVDDKIVSCALVLASTESDALIGGVATLEEYRNLGLAQKCIYELISRNINKNIFIFCKEDKICFYNKLGFEKYANTAEVNL
ncbi:MAG: GNAT family N-acetyltransferase [Oscillospiraceae bacterium]